jgi:hypothetical protein
MRARVTPWLLLLPALTLLVAFTHWPALATVWDSFQSTPKKGRPAHFIGLDNYRGMVEDEVFWQALTNNVIYAVGTIPLSIALAIAMALWVEQPPRRPRLPAPGVLHADGAADDRRRQHLALLLHAAVRACSSRSRRRSACRATTGSATSTPCSARSSSSRSGRRPASS